jgi:hypothetical protein
MIGFAMVNSSREFRGLRVARGPSLAPVNLAFPASSADRLEWTLTNRLVGVRASRIPTPASQHNGARLNLLSDLEDIWPHHRRHDTLTGDATEPVLN